MAYQRPGARVIASEFEWQTVGRCVLPDAVPIIILWPFSPIRFVYQLQDTGPPIDRESINDFFAAKGEFRLGRNQKRPLRFIELNRSRGGAPRRRTASGGST
jgi:hypothetical protein